MRTCFLFAVSLLLAACGREEPAQPEPRPEDKVLLDYAKKPLDQAQQVQQTLDANKQKLDKAIEDQETKPEGE